MQDSKLERAHVDLYHFDRKIDSFLDAIRENRFAYGLPLQLRELAKKFLNSVLALLFPHFCVRCSMDPEDLREKFLGIGLQLEKMLQDMGIENANDTTIEFLNGLPETLKYLQNDAAAIHRGDPAAESVDEVILAYPGFHAIAVYRIAHQLYQSRVPILPRVLTEIAHSKTGIDIHPGARIGSEFSIDHGTGVVIGETTLIGDRVRIFQGVTLGALAVSKDLQKTKRHPTIGDDVVIYANATILGGNTEIGARTIVGGNVWLTQCIPPDSFVTRTSEIRQRNQGVDELLDYYL